MENADDRDQDESIHRSVLSVSSVLSVVKTHLLNWVGTVKREIALWTGRKPTLRTYEMICFYLAGMASEAELLAHLAKLDRQEELKKTH